MLWFIGTGISGYTSLTVEALDIIKKAHYVYLEQFTSPIKHAFVNEIKEITTSKFIMAPRWKLEDGNEILKNAKNKNVVVLVYGDPYVATTHIDLRIRANREKIKTKTIHASSSITSIIGECGLHHYKLGRITTIINNLKMTYTPYYVIYRNMIEDNHSVLLLEFNYDKKFFLDPKTALNNLLAIEKLEKRKVITANTYAIVASRVGYEDQNIIAGKISSLCKINFGDPPHTIIIIGSLHFTEHDAIKNLLMCTDEPISNSSNLKTITEQLLNAYIPKLNETVNHLLHTCTEKEIIDLLDNAISYSKDARQFFIDKQNEIAMLSIGYAEGLVDALKFMSGSVKLKRFG
jgi:diphthine synthase